MKSFFKNVSYFLARLLTGFAGPRRGEGAVLMYHAVDRSGWRVSVTPDEFEWQLDWLSRNRVVVPLTDIVRGARGELELPKGAVALTFDDGYADLIPFVLPLLARYNFPMTLFLNTDVAAKTNSVGSQRVTWEEVLALRDSGLVSIQNHCRTHPHLPKLSVEEATSEIEGGAEDIEAKLGARPTQFAYPYGDRSPSVEKLVSDLGYEAAFAITEGFVGKGSDLMHLPRIQVDLTMNRFLFTARLTPALMAHRRTVGGTRRVLDRHHKD